MIKIQIGRLVFIRVLMTDLSFLISYFGCQRKQCSKINLFNTHYIIIMHSFVSLQSPPLTLRYYTTPCMLNDDKMLFKCQPTFSAVWQCRLFVIWLFGVDCFFFSFLFEFALVQSVFFFFSNCPLIIEYWMR